MNRPVNLPLLLDDGRLLIVKRGGGKTLVARQKEKGPAITVGETVLTKPGKDGRKAVLRCVKRTKKDCTFEILGSVDGKRSDVGKPDGT